MRRLVYILYIVLAMVVGYGCAKTGTIYGGPKDEKPPEIIKAKPPERSVNFVPQKKIVLLFNEYIQLKDIFSEMIISPPLNDRIMAQVKGKGLIVEFPKDAVFDTTTYTISFGNAIADNNEGNVLPNYQYVFSLKDYIDTMNVDGRIVNAFDLKPDAERMLVMLYKNLNDSAPLLEIPSYICRSDKEGNFTINNIETGSYRLFALKDANMNMIYDLPNENIAFSDSVIIITPEMFLDNVIIQDSALYDSLLKAETALPDTIFPGQPEDTIMTPADQVYVMIETSGPDSVADTTVIDSMIIQNYYTFHTELFFFTAKSYNQYMTNYLRPRRELLTFTFNEALSDTFELFPLNYTPGNKDWYILDASEDLDTLSFWITDTTMAGMDSLKMEFCYQLPDSSGIKYYRPDTFLMQVQEDKKSGKESRSRTRLKDDETEEKLPVLSVRNNILKANAFDLNKNIALISETPLKRIIPDSIKLFRVQDTLEFPVAHSIVFDTSSLYRVYINYSPEEETSYRLFCPDSILTDVYGVMNDTIEVRFKTKSLSSYSTLSVNISGVKSAYVLQLMTEKEEVLTERMITSDGKQRFEFLNPGKYKLKIISDRNGNGVWDTGDYLKKVQPEKVLYFDQPVELRTNWEMEFSWEMAD